MKNNPYGNKKKLNKKGLCMIVVLLWIAVKTPTTNFENLALMITTQMIPVLTYEKLYGNGNVDYVANYDVPDWFYEDEDMQNDDLAVEEESNDVQEVKEVVENILPNESAVTYSREQLADKDFLLSKIFVVDGNTNMTKEELDLTNLLDKDLSIDGIGEEGNENQDYKVLIYHTHGSEAFKDSREGKKEDTIIGVGSYLTKLLEEKYHISVYHDETAYDVIDGALDRSKAYENAYQGVSKILKENPSIEVVIDLHRDGVDEETRLVTSVGGKKTAKIMFLNGVSRSNTNGDIEYLKNPNKLDNLAFSFQMYLAGKEEYGEYIRKIYVRSYRYNLHVLPRTTLIEVGAQNNTIEEEKNAMEPLAAILYKVLSKKE